MQSTSGPRLSKHSATQLWNHRSGTWENYLILTISFVAIYSNTTHGDIVLMRCFEGSWVHQNLFCFSSNPPKNETRRQTEPPPFPWKFWTHKLPGSITSSQIFLRETSTLINKVPHMHIIVSSTHPLIYSYPHIHMNANQADCTYFIMIAHYECEHCEHYVHE